MKDLLHCLLCTFSYDVSKKYCMHLLSLQFVFCRSFGGIANTKDKRPSTVSQGNVRPSMTTTRTVPSDLDISFDGAE